MLRHLHLSLLQRGVEGVLRGTDTLRTSPRPAFGPAGRPPTSLTIDPTLFERFGMDKVLTFVLPVDTSAPCTPAGYPLSSHLQVTGDMRLVRLSVKGSAV